jgi:drug/metabolite transporter (DMT)-like permease
MDPSYASPRVVALRAMLGVAYGLGAALVWGTADFFARLAAERMGARRTLFWMQVLGLLFTAALLALPALRPHALEPRTLALAAAIGLFNMAGGLLLYRALEVGTVSLVSPISSTFAAIAALLAIVAGERPSAVQLGGLALTVAGMVGAAIPPPRPSSGSHESSGEPKEATRRGLGLAALAALSWGIAFFALRFVVGELGSLFPVALSRLISVVVVGAGSRALGASLAPPPRAVWPLVAGVALFDSGAFVLYNLGIASALTAVVSILSSLFSAVTVLLAFVFLRERLAPRQWAAVLVILAGVGMVSSGA